MHSVESLLAERWMKGVFIALVGVWLFVLVGLPLYTLLSKSMYDKAENFVGLANFIQFFSEPALFNSLGHSLFVSFCTVAISLPLGFGFAYCLSRTSIRGKKVFRALAMSPLFAPTLMHGLVLIYLFGKKGLITKGFFGSLTEFFGFHVGWDIGLYGVKGIIIAESIYAFPSVFLILSVALSMSDARLYEAAEALGASKWRIFRTVTLPGVKFGLVSAFFVAFIASFTDFGAPKVVGGNYNVLATDIYKQVIGQQNFFMGATVSVVLLIPTALAFLANHLIQRRQTSAFAAKAVPYSPQKNAARDTVAFIFCTLISFLFVAYLSTGVYASLVDVWPYKLGLSVRHYDFEAMGGGGYSAYWNSLRMSVYTAVFGCFTAFFSAYVLEKFREFPRLRQICSQLSLLPMALPGLVIGLAYIFFFNKPGWEITSLGLFIPNPLSSLYGTMGILVISNLIYFHTVSFLTASTALKQLDYEFESVSESLSAPFTRLFARVTVPVCMPAILEIGYYFFVRSMTTLSAVIFLYSADLPIAVVAVANMDDAGDTAPALAMCVLIVATNLVVRMFYGMATSGLRKRTNAWSQR
jgi:iron(III) transport system permease protein